MIEEIDFSKYFYYDETSPSCLRRKIAWRTGKDGVFLREGVDSAAGSLNGKGTYYLIYCCGKRFQAHRVVWQILKDKLEAHEKIDHEDGNGLNNKILNLRKADNELNTRNAKLRKDSSTKVVGVCLSNSTQRNGNVTQAYVAHWCDLNKKRCSKSFALSIYGKEGAFELACNHRQKMIEELNALGAGYTERHGT